MFLRLVEHAVRMLTEEIRDEAGNMSETDRPGNYGPLEEAAGRLHGLIVLLRQQSGEADG